LLSSQQLPKFNRLESHLLAAQICMLGEEMNTVSARALNKAHLVKALQKSADEEE